MSSDNEIKPMDHEYDGIQECDNPLPMWWLIIFVGTIIFAFFYWFHYTYGGGKNLQQELAQEMSKLPTKVEKVYSEDSLQTEMNKPENMTLGHAVFTAKCAVCHGAEGQGQIGPNLTDKFWLNGRGQRADIIKVISAGVLEKGMPAWGTILSEQELVAVTGFVYSLRDKHPANAKAPEGTEVKE